MGVESERVPLGAFLLDEGSGPALPISESEARALVARVIAAGRPRARRWRGPRRRASLWVAAVTLATTAAAAAYQRGWHLPWLSRDETPADPAPAEGQRKPPQGARSAAPKPPASALPASVPEPAPELGAALPSTSIANEASSRVDAPRSNPDAVKPRASAVHRDPARERAARDELSRANALRGERRYAEALEAYLKVVELNPKGLPAQAARVAAGAIALERFGDSQRAARLYSAAAARGGELGGEALFGLAETHRARGDAAAERAALRRFLKEHPQHPLAAAAGRRLQRSTSP